MEGIYGIIVQKKIKHKLKLFKSKQWELWPGQLGLLNYTGWESLQSRRNKHKLLIVCQWFMVARRVTLTIYFQLSSRIFSIFIKNARNINASMQFQYKL